jgi:hypothetical protein
MPIAVAISWLWPPTISTRMTAVSRLASEPGWGVA